MNRPSCRHLSFHHCFLHWSEQNFLRLPLTDWSSGPPHTGHFLPGGFPSRCRSHAASSKPGSENLQEPLTGSPSWRQYSMTCSSVRPICSAIAVQLSPASRSIRTHSRSTFCAFPWITFSYGMAVICSSMSGPSSVGAYPAAIGSWTIRFLGRYKFLSTDRAGFQLCGFPVFRFRMFGPPPLPAGGRAEFSGPAQRIFIDCLSTLRAKAIRHMREKLRHCVIKFTDFIFIAFHLPPPFHSAAKGA